MLQNCVSHLYARMKYDYTKTYNVYSFKCYITVMLYPMSCVLIVTVKMWAFNLPYPVFLHGLFVDMLCKE